MKSKKEKLHEISVRINKEYTYWNNWKDCGCK
jgi:hypothetical protein